MRKKIIWSILSCLMVIPLMLGSCAPAVTEEEKALQAEVEVFVSRFFEAVAAKNIDYLSDKWWEGVEGQESGGPPPKGRKGLSRESAEGLISGEWEGYQGIETICVEVYEGVVRIPLIEGGKIELRPVPGLQGDTATYEGKLIYASGIHAPLLIYRGFHLFKLGGEWKIYGEQAAVASQGCP